MAYTVTVYVSTSGIIPHTWIDLNNGTANYSYGYARLNSHSTSGPGDVSHDTDDGHPYDYSRSWNITQ